ncbi:MAG: hypothetical protein ABI377_05090 [Devosia sp.]
MPHFRIQLISESAAAYEFEDARLLKELSDGVVRDGYITFEGISNRLGNANQGSTRQTVFAANIARIIER